MNAQLETVNPRIAAGLSVEEWERRSKLRRRREWEERAQRHSVDGPATRSAAASLAARTPVRVEVNHELARWQEGSCLDRAVPLGIPREIFRTESGMTMRSYYRAKYLRCGTLGTNGPLNPLLGESKLWEKEARHAK